MADTKIGKYDRYWKLESYRKSTKAALVVELQKKGIQPPTSNSKEELIEVLHRLERGLLHYDDPRITTKELTQFINNRRLTPPVSGTRKAAIRVLIGADEGQTFTRFLDLPPELREVIYVFYVSAFPKWLDSPVQPPLAHTCKLIRREMLPTFYRIPTFIIDTFFAVNTTETNEEISKGALRLSPDATGFIHSLSSQPDRRVGNLRIKVSASSTKEMLSGEAKPIFHINCTMKQAGNSTATYGYYGDKKPAKFWTLRKNSKVASTMQKRSRHREKGLFTVDDIYAIRRAAENTFFATYTKNGEWN